MTGDVIKEGRSRSKKGGGRGNSPKKVASPQLQKWKH